VNLDGEIEERNGFNFAKFNVLKIVFTVGKGSLQLGNLFGGDKLLGTYIYRRLDSISEFASKSVVLGPEPKSTSGHDHKPFIPIFSPSPLQPISLSRISLYVFQVYVFQGCSSPKFFT
jgi:hypothetical protein